MLTYILGLFISIVLAIIIKAIWGFKTKKTLKMFISILPLTLISAFRYNVGWDYNNIYVNGFYMVGKYNLKWFTEPLFRLIIKVLYNMTGNPLSLFIFMSILTALFFSLSYSRYEKNGNAIIYIVLYVITRYYYCSLNIIRQALAMMIIVYAVSFIKEKKFWKYLIVILFASGFHMLSLVYIPLYFILDLDMKKKKSILILICSTVLLGISSYLFITKTKYSSYFESMFGNDGTIYFSELLISIIIVFVGWFYYNKLVKDKDLNALYNMELISFIFCIASFILPTGDRIVWYFTINNIFLVPNMLQLGKNDYNKMVFSIIIFTSIFMVFVMQSVNDSYAVLPYYSVFNKEK